jgi:hypothetical protein
MDADLAKNKQPWVIAFDHYPYHSLGFFNSNPDAVGCCQLLTKYKVPLYICGHDHSYQRTARISNDNQRTLADDATVHLISGGAGGQFGQYLLPTPSWNLAHVNRFHYTQVEVDDQVITFRAVDLEGNIFDQWKMPIKGQPETIFDGKPFVMVDDRDSEVVYNNPWTCESMSNARWSNPTWKQRRNQTNCWRSHASFSSNSGDFASLKFTGISIAWIGTKGNEQGLADVFIDGELVAPDLDTSATKLQYQQILFEKTDLHPGEHEIKIVVKGKFGAATKRGGAVDIDAFRYTP